MAFRGGGVSLRGGGYKRRKKGRGLYGASSKTWAPRGILRLFPGISKRGSGMAFAGSGMQFAGSGLRRVVGRRGAGRRLI